MKHLVNLIKDGSKKYLKHWTYVDNCSNVFPLMEDTYSGKFIELDFLQNLAIRSKLEVQSAYFFNKQYTLHCAIAKPFKSNTTAWVMTPGMVAFLLTTCWEILLSITDIENEDLWVQSANASSQYKNITFVWIITIAHWQVQSLHHMYLRHCWAW